MNAVSSSFFQYNYSNSALKIESNEQILTFFCFSEALSLLTTLTVRSSNPPKSSATLTRSTPLKSHQFKSKASLPRTPQKRTPRRGSILPSSNPHRTDLICGPHRGTIRTIVPHLYLPRKITAAIEAAAIPRRTAVLLANKLISAAAAAGTASSASPLRRTSHTTPGSPGGSLGGETPRGVGWGGGPPGPWKKQHVPAPARLMLPAPERLERQQDPPRAKSRERVGRRPPPFSSQARRPGYL